jgi:HTH-type transcriptional regulator/antitoxin HipB
MRLVITTPLQVAEIVRGRRKSRQLSQGQLANKLGISQSRLSALEAGTTALTVERLISLANVLGLQLILQDKADSAGQKTEW